MRDTKTDYDWVTPVTNPTHDDDGRESVPTLTYDPELAPGYFVQVRSDFFLCNEFSLEARSLYVTLLIYCGKKITAFPGQERLAEHMGVGRTKVWQALNELIEAGFVQVKRRGQGLTNIYHVRKLPLVVSKRE